MTMRFDLEKLIWNESDFEQMGWHDSKIHAIAFRDETFELALDIDYIVEWVQPNDNKANFQFWITPSTLVFRNVCDLTVSVEANLSLQIQDIYKTNPRLPKNAKHIQESFEYDWTIETNNGEITFKSVGYRQYFRKKPILSDSQKITLEQRGGVCFDIIKE
jgi:hypothetical protein